jgi:uncharacterized protein (DUF2062 family)
MRPSPESTAGRWLERLLHIHDTPRRTAAAYGVGVFFGFSPFLGLHTVLALICAFAFNLNRAAVILGVYSNLPWIIAPYYFVTTLAGAAILRVDAPESLAVRVGEVFEISIWDPAFWNGLAALTKPLLWSYMLGSTLGAIILGWIGYRLALAFITARRARRRDVEPRADAP